MSTQKLKLVLLPGLDGTGNLFKDFVAALPEELEFRILSYRSDEFEDYSVLAAHLAAALADSTPYFLLAESFSTPLAIEFAAKFPKNLSGLILCAGFASSPLTGSLRGACSLLASMLFRVPLSAVVARFFLLGPDSSRQSVGALQKAIGQVKRQVLAARLRAVLACNVVESLRQVEVPILYIQAIRDRLVSPSSLETIAKANRHVTSEAILGPHLILQQRPAEAAAIVARFAASLDL